MASPHAGSYLRQARLDAGLTQVELAEKCGLKQPTISAIERGDDRLTARVAIFVELALELEPMELVRRAEDLPAILAAALGQDIPGLLGLTSEPHLVAV